MRDGTFGEISGTSGLDFEGDGRSVLATDWDGDGDQDLWLRSRTAPMLRYLENQSNPRHVRVDLRAAGVKVDGPHRAEAIGARVAFVTNLRTIHQEVRAGEGYLAQSSSTLNFALRTGVPTDPELAGGPSSNSSEREEPLALLVTWPGETEEQKVPISIPTGTSGVHIELRQGMEPREIEGRSPLKLDSGALLPSTLPRRVVLRSPLPLPFKLPGIGSQGMVWIVNLQPSIPGPSLLGLRDALASAGITVGVLHPAEGRAAWKSVATAGLQVETLTEEQALGWWVLTRHMIEFVEAEPGPMLWLVDAAGRVQALHFGLHGSEEIESIKSDCQSFLLQSAKGSFRGAFPGRWFHGAERDYPSLSQDLDSAKFPDWAQKYRR